MVSYLRFTLFDGLSRLLFYLIGIGRVEDHVDEDRHPIRVSSSFQCASLPCNSHVSEAQSSLKKV
jgi:hypothetical protein